MTTLALLLLALSALGPGASRPGPQPQDAPPAEAPQDSESPAERARRERAERVGGATAGSDEVLGPDGAPLRRGELPASATPEARAAWEALRQAVLAPEPVRAFDLSFYLVQRQETPQSNTFEARIRFLAPDYVRSVLTKSERELLRGPKGDWLLDNGERIKLIGREGAEDRRQLDEIVGIARNFVALTDPASLRIAALELLKVAPGGLPETLRARGPALRWLAITSPDFRLYQTPPRAAGAPPPMFRALLGLEPATHQVELALIHEAGSPAVLVETTLLVHLQDLRRQADFLVPRKIDVYQMDANSMPWRFREKPSSELTLRSKGLDLRPQLAPADFETE